MNEPFYKNVIFDLDGTLTDSQEGIVNALMHALKALKINTISQQDLAGYIGIPLQELFLKHFHISEDKLEAAVFHFRNYYRTKGAYENKLYPGIKKLLASLYNKAALYIATAKLESNTIIILEHFGLIKYFKGVAGADAVGINAGKTYLVAKLMNDYNLEKGNCSVMIGDKSMDINAARDCNIHSIGLTYGYGSREEIVSAGPTFIAHSVKELQMILFSVCL